MAGNSLYPARNVSYSTQTKMPPCFLYLSNTWSTAVLLPEFPSVLAWQRGSAHKTALCVLPPIPSPKEAPSPFLSAVQMGNQFLSSTEVHTRKKAGDTACAVMRHRGQKKQNRALRQVVSQGSPNRELMYRKAQSLGITVVVG